MGKIKFRDATLEDCDLLFEWANNKDVRQNSFNNDPIEWEDHKKWFIEKLRSQSSRIFILYLTNVAVGQVRYDIDPDGVAEVDISIVPSFRGKGYGGMGLQMTSRHVLRELKAKKIVCHIKTNNYASYEAFKKAGFVENDTVDIRGCKVYEMSLTKE